MNLGIIGCGAIGSTLAKAAEELSPIKEVYLFDKSHVCSRVLEEKFSKVQSVLSLEELIERSDFIIEAAAQEAVLSFCERILEHGTDVLIMSVGALVDEKLRAKFESIAKENGARIYIPTGAICGIDGVNSASVTGIEEVILETRKPPIALMGEAYIKDNNIDLENLTEPKLIFEGSAKEAVVNFPRNVNVAATVSLAGIGFERTKVRLIVDPETSQNHHKITVKGTFGTMETQMNNLPFDKNPKTSRIAAQSAIAALKKIVGTYWIGV